MSNMMLTFTSLIATKQRTSVVKIH